MKELILIDDHALLRKGIASYLAEHSDWRIVAEAENMGGIPDIIAQFGGRGGDDVLIAVVDIQLKGDGPNALASNGYKAVRMLLDAGIRSVVFSSHDTSACIEKAMSEDVGARGFVSKVSDEQMLLSAIDTVADGRTFIQPDLAAGLLERRGVFSVLTRREQQTARLIAEGLTNEEISDALGIKVTTLENYLSVIYDKLGCADRAELMERLR